MVAIPSESSIIHSIVIKKELNEKSEKLKEFMKTKAENERLVREKNELRQQLELENERKLNEQIQQERERIIKLESEKSEMQLNELKKQKDTYKTNVVDKPQGNSHPPDHHERGEEK